MASAYKKVTFTGGMLAGLYKAGGNAVAGTPMDLGVVELEQDMCFTIPASITTFTDSDGQNISQYNWSPAIAFAAFGSAATNSITIPPQCTIHDIIVDVPTAIVGPTAANLTIGITATGQDYVSTLNLMTGPVIRVRPTFTNAQLLAMMNTTTNITVFAQVTGTVANFTAGVVLLTVIYSMNPQ